MIKIVIARSASGKILCSVALIDESSSNNSASSNKVAKVSDSKGLGHQLTAKPFIPLLFP